MKLPAPSNPAKYFAALALKTRKFGHCYVHAAAKSLAGKYDGITFHVSGYGRSLQGGGHKYKVHAMRDGKPVPTRELKSL